MDKETLDVLAALLDTKLSPLKEEILEVKKIALEARDAATEAKDMATEAKTAATEAKDVATGAKNESRQTRVLVEAQAHKIDLLMEAQAETKAKFTQLDRIEKTLNDTKMEVEVIRDVVRRHSGEIRDLRKAQ